jgi:hypothetical protein
MIKLICIIIVSFFALSLFDITPSDACEPDLKITLKNNKPKRAISSAKKKAKTKIAAKSKKKSKTKVASKTKIKKKTKVASKGKGKMKPSSKSKSYAYSKTKV